MKVIRGPVRRDTILKEHNTYFRTMIKAVVDIEQKILAIDAELHADLEQVLLAHGSRQENLWGVNLFIEKERSSWIEYTALINIRPSMNNPDMEVKDPRIRERIAGIVNDLVLE